MDNKKLQEILRQKGIKQTWVAEKLGVSSALVSQWISGEKQISDKYRIELISLLK